MPIINSSRKKFLGFHYQSRTGSQETKATTPQSSAKKCLTPRTIKKEEISKVQDSLISTFSNCVQLYSLYKIPVIIHLPWKHSRFFNSISYGFQAKVRSICADLKMGFERLWSPQTSALLLDLKYPQLTTTAGNSKRIEKYQSKRSLRVTNGI